MEEKMKKNKRRFIFSVYVQDLVAIPLAQLLVKHKVHPNIVTLFSIFISMLVGYLYLEKLYIFGSILFFLALILDSTDGKVARGLGVVTESGKILDSISDKLRSIIVLLGFAIGQNNIKVAMVMITYYFLLPIVRPIVKKILNLTSDPTEIFWYSTRLKNWLSYNKLCGIYNGWERSVLALGVAPILKSSLLLFFISILIEQIIYILGIVKYKTESIDIDPY